jgi:uncharacterized membrane protein YfcA
MQALLPSAWEQAMDGVLDLSLFLAATFAAALVAGLAGFAFGLVAAAVWLHILTPLDTATLIVAFGLIVQGYSVWKLRHALRWQRLWPFLAGAAIGVPIGVAILGYADPRHVRKAVGGLLVLYGLYGLARPALKPVAAGIPADAAVGFLNGVLGGFSGLAGILVTIWSGLRGWSKDEQRTVFQPVGIAIFAMTALWLGIRGALSADVLMLFGLGLPVLLVGTWAGLKLYGRLDETGFRKVVLGLLLASGVLLLV